ncbi:MAG: MerR family transcriptional regulator [Ruminococcus sp.]|nr:MerR family transcriptional regulator [uncultured Schaedlerella sp.]MCI9153724.1 MerR family transcriptional regulator [Ruminococcus sp.]
MNTKQIEELTGITRQNIRYYERQGLLEPARDTGNAYRDYSGEDLRRLKLIKMLRMLDMPIKEIGLVLEGKLPLKEAAAKQQEVLLQQQKQIQAAVEVCANIRKEKSEVIDVDGYLDRMEHMAGSGSVFARIVDDYKQVAEEERQRQFSFYTDRTVNTAGRLEEELQKWAKEGQRKFRMVHPGRYPEFTLDGVSYTAACKVEQDQETKEPRTRIVCSREEDEKVKKEVRKNRRAVFQGIYSIGANIRRHRFKSILNGVISMMTVAVLIFYLGNLVSARQQFEELPEAIPVRAVVMNGAGNLNSGLFIRQEVLDMVYASPYIWKIRETAELVGHMAQVEGGDMEEAMQAEEPLQAAEGTGAEEPAQADKGDGAEEPAQADKGAGAEEPAQADKGAGAEEPIQAAEGTGAEGPAQADKDPAGGAGDIPWEDEFQILGINDLESVYEDCEKDLTWADGWNWEKFQESGDVCIAGTTFLQGHNLEPGDRLSCSLEHYIRAAIGLGLEREGLKPLEMEIVGVIDDTEAEESMAAEVMLPLGAVRQIYEDNDKVYFASSLRFTVKEPMKLNELKQDLREPGLTSVVPGSNENYAGAALRMEDDVFIQASLGLEKSISLLEGFLPFVLRIVVLSGYIVPHLLLQGRKGEYAIMRALGTSKRRCTLVFFAEHMLLAACGGAVGTAIGAIFGTADILTAWMVWGIFLCCYTLGAAAALWMFGRMSIAAVLTHQ